MSASTHASGFCTARTTTPNSLFRSFSEERLDDLNAILLPQVMLDQALGVASNPRSVAGSSISSMSA